MHQFEPVKFSEWESTMGEGVPICFVIVSKTADGAYKTEEEFICRCERFPSVNLNINYKGAMYESLLSSYTKDKGPLEFVVVTVKNGLLSISVIRLIATGTG